MKKKRQIRCLYRHRMCEKVIRTMKLISLLLLLGVMHVSAITYSQTAKVSLQVKEGLIERVFELIEQQSEYVFVYNHEQLSRVKRVTAKFKDEDITTVLKACLLGSGLDYEVVDHAIVIKQAGVQENVRITGKVTDVQKNPLPGATVRLKGVNVGAISDRNGNYTLSVPAMENMVLVFSFVGMQTQEVRYTGQGSIDVVLREDVATIDEVVVTGMFNRRLETETGSSVQFKGEQLREVGNQNVLKSLANLDPSFMILESLEFGSDPNRLPEIMMRGQSSFPDLQGEYSGNPNQPLFILDGFETTLQKVYDLDMNRVSSITILKDASAKAIYGSKAGNGVVVIESIRPAQGEIRLSYSGTLDLEAPDLTGYNLMNAEEKLAFELSRGMYGGNSGVDATYGQNNMEIEYHKILRDVLRGVDTYWLSKPLREGVGHKHSLNFEGGDERIRYGIGLNYNNLKGVMKGSNRNTFSGNMNFVYHYRNLIFRNTLEVTFNNATNSPYGSFSEYTRLNPYWATHDDEGNLKAVLGRYQNETYYNPLYNVSINTKNISGYTEIRNNFQMEWKILPELRVTSRFSFSNNTSESDVFYPSTHTMFISYAEDQSDRKGRYTKKYSKSTSYQADIGINYGKGFNKHMIFANGTWNMSSSESRSHTYIAEGFGNDKMDDIAFGTRYMTGTTPDGSSDNRREIGLVGALNYSYDNRYLFDASARTSGSSMFGTDQKWGIFWSLGLGWNIHNEAFAANAQWLDRFKVRGSLGYTGSQNFDPYQAKARYEYAQNVYDSGYGAIILGLPNDRLKWQRVLDYNVGTDLSLLNRITLKFDYFITITDDLLIDMALPPSIGFSTYKENLGKVENKGFDMNLGLQLWRNSEKNGWFTVLFTGMHNKNKIKKISDTFEHRNNQQDAEKNQTVSSSDFATLKSYYTRPSTLYYEGQSMTAIWGVRSAGIDPQTGRELFYNLKGKLVRDWSARDQVVLGDRSPKLRGNINLNAGWKGFTVALACSYKFGGKMYNTTLVDRVENTNGRYNLDRRILQAWSQKGDVSLFRHLYISQTAYSGISATKPTSRFVMDDNELYISSLNVGYNVRNKESLSRMGMENLRLSFYMNELYRYSSIMIERGTSYPFARNFSLSLQATF